MVVVCCVWFRVWCLLFGGAMLVVRCLLSVVCCGCFMFGSVCAVLLVVECC